MLTYIRCLVSCVPVVLRLLALGAHFSIVRAVGYMLGFQFVLVLGFACCECESVARCVDFPASLSVALLAS
jgi:hypothetical protein